MAAGGPDEGRMIMKLSGKVSGILDDLTEAMTMLQDIVPHAESLQDTSSLQQVLQAPGSLIRNMHVHTSGDDVHILLATWRLRSSLQHGSNPVCTSCWTLRSKAESSPSPCQPTVCQFAHAAALMSLQGAMDGGSHAPWLACVQKLMAAQGSLQQHVAASSGPLHLEPPSPRESLPQGDHSHEAALGPNDVLPKKRRLAPPIAEPQPAPQA